MKRTILISALWFACGLSAAGCGARSSLSMPSPSASPDAGSATGGGGGAGATSSSSSSGGGTGGAGGGTALCTLGFPGAPLLRESFVGWAITTPDLNGDGWPDLVHVGDGGGLGTPGTLSVRLNLGNGTFTAAATHELGTNAGDVVTADLNGDGWPDVAATNFSDWTVSVLLNQGDGTFGARMDHKAGGQPRAVTAADLTGDGWPDLALTYVYPPTVGVLVNQGDGTFSAPILHETGNHPHKIAAADFDGNGTQDIAVTTSAGTVSVLLGAGDGSLGPEVDHFVGQDSYPGALTVADLNGDGSPDLAVASGMLLWNQGDGSFVVEVTGGLPPGFAGAAADVNGDGALDLVVADELGTAHVLFNQGDGTFPTWTSHEAGDRPTAIAAADLNGDGFPDLATATQFAVNLVLSRPDGTLPPVVVLPASPGNSPESVVATDLNGDGAPDLAVPKNNESAVAVLLQQGDGSFAAPVDYAVEGYPQQLVAADLNGDGAPDLAALGYSANQDMISVLFHQDNGTFAAGAILPLPGGGNAIAVADLDGDGWPDLAATTQESGANKGGVSVFRSQGDGTFAAPVYHPVGENVVISIAAADLDGDGRTDLAVTRWSTYTSITSIDVLLNQGDGSFALALTEELGKFGYSLTTADLNGDGSTDLAAGGRVLLNQGNGSFAAPIDVGGEACAAGDLNGDGWLDLVSCGAGVVLNQGDGTFVKVEHYAAGSSPEGVALADMNGDGWLDIAVAKAGGVRVLQNQQCLPQ